MIKNYINLKKVLKNAIAVNYKIHEEIKDYDDKDIRYFLMEDPDFFIFLRNYKSTTEKILKKIG